MPSARVFVALAFVMLCPAIAKADKLTITSTPLGATVEIDGMKVGTTPFVKDYPPGYFHRPMLSVKKRLEYPMVARVKLEGFTSKEIQLCDGPLQWRDIHGRVHGEYWTFKEANFQVVLDPIRAEFTGGVSVTTAQNKSLEFVQNLSLAEVVERVKPSVVYLEGGNISGTGFFVTKTGVIATNAHLARGREYLKATLPSKIQMDAKVVYTADDVDIALLKMEGVTVPCLTMADTATLTQGQEVLAVGNPGEAMLFSVTKGVISGFQRDFPSAGPGFWIQTDAPLNPGNSGGPLVNMQGEVVGMTTSKPAGGKTTGIGFALGASELLRVLANFYPRVNVLPEQLAAPSSPEIKPAVPLSQETPGQKAPEEPPKPNSPPTAVTYGIVEVRGPANAEILIDRKRRGYAPAVFQLTSGWHFFVVLPLKGAAQMQQLNVIANSRVTLEPPPALREPMQ